MDDFLGVEKVCTGGGIMSISQKKMKIEVRARESERFYRRIEQKATAVGMSLNKKKTQLICVSAALHSDVSTYIKLDQEIIRSQQELKILGYYFGPEPSVSEHISKISQKFRRRVWILRHLKKADIPEKDLIKLYMSLVLPVLDYLCVTYHSMLNAKCNAEPCKNIGVTARQICPFRIDANESSSDLT